MPRLFGLQFSPHAVHTRIPFGSGPRGQGFSDPDTILDPRPQPFDLFFSR